jgi:hypothetical protein
MTKRNWIFGSDYMQCLNHQDGTPPVGTRGGQKLVALVPDAEVRATKQRLGESVGNAEALEAVREIVCNLLGCEIMCLLRFNRQGREPWLFWSFGIDFGKHRAIGALHEPVWSCVALGSTHIVKDLKAQGLKENTADTSVFVPIRSNGEIIAVLALLQFLPQKQEIDNVDMKIFQVLSEEAGNALFGSSADVVPAIREKHHD